LTLYLKDIDKCLALFILRKSQITYAINITVADRSYRLKIAPEDEEMKYLSKKLNEKI